MAENLKLVTNPSTNDKDTKFNSLDSDWRNAVANSSPEELKKQIYELVEEEELNQKNKNNDQQLAEAKEGVASASRQYRDATKGYKLRVKYIMQVLGDKGKA